jgi:hypothetical protein
MGAGRIASIRYRERWLRMRPRHRELIADLTLKRPNTSLIERELLSVVAPIYLDHSNWVRMWVDPEHSVRSDCGQITAMRGVTWEGQLIWLVHHREKRHGYHSAHACPFDAIEEAQGVWVERRRVRQNWPFVQSLARDLLLGRRKLEVRIEDAHASALCSFGIDGFLKRIGFGRAKRTSGRVVALMMLLDDQAGFVLLAAYERVHGPLISEQKEAHTVGSQGHSRGISDNQIVASPQRD